MSTHQGVMWRLACAARHEASATTVHTCKCTQEEGLQQFQQYLCKLVAERGQEGYNTLVEGGVRAQFSHRNAKASSCLI